MAEIHRIYLDQMFRLDVAEELRNQGYDVVRASQTGHARADDRQVLEKSITEEESAKQVSVASRSVNVLKNLHFVLPFT